MLFENVKDQEGDYEGFFYDEDYKLNFVGFVNFNVKFEFEMQKISIFVFGEE